MVKWNEFYKNLNSHNAVWATPEEFFNDINEYVMGCQYIEYEKLNVGDGCSELETLTNYNGDPIVKWFKLPTVTGFCASKGILRETYYNQRKRKNHTYGLVMDYFSNIIQAAAEQSLVEGKSFKSYRSAIYMLESKDRAIKRKQTDIENKNKNERDKLQNERDRIHNELAKVQINLIQEKINQMKQGNDAPYIDTFSADLNSAIKNIDSLSDDQV